MLRIYTYMTTLRSKLLPVNPQVLLQSADICDLLCQKIVNREMLQLNMLQTTGLPDGIKYALQQLITVWNRKCSKV